MNTLSPSGRLSIEAVRDSVIGADAVLETPFGERALVYADFGASGRASQIVEDRVAAELALYANPHNEDSATGHAATAALHAACAEIKRAVGADESHALVAAGFGATAGVQRLVEILGLAIPPATRAALETALGDDLTRLLGARRPLVFVGPYEHHSNELVWRESLAEVICIGLAGDGGMDMAELAAHLADPVHAGRRKIGAFSAASNVTGVKTDVSALARLLHGHGAILALDCAASAPYAPLDMSGGGDPLARIDALYCSPHKMIGGPGACGVLVFDTALYRSDLAPTVSGGGTVRYVTPGGHDFLDDIEARERAGTPGLPQIRRAALAFDLLDQVGWDQIEQAEHAHLDAALNAWAQTPGITLYGPSDAQRRIALVSFNLVTPGGAAIHPKLAARLLNDLFGIQARAGCSCAGPYGHALLDLDDAETEAYRGAVLAGHAGLRPGWVRVSLHWSMSAAERDYLIEAVRLLAAFAERFAGLYRFDSRTGAWTLKAGDGESRLAAETGGPALLDSALAEVRAMADRLACAAPQALDAPLAGLRPIAGVEAARSRAAALDV
jgi:selenocysteine lyase/cysteine desulfurase